MGLLSAKDGFAGRIPSISQNAPRKPEKPHSIVHGELAIIPVSTQIVTEARQGASADPGPHVSTGLNRHPSAVTKSRSKISADQLLPCSPSSGDRITVEQTDDGVRLSVVFAAGNRHDVM